MIPQPLPFAVDWPPLLLELVPILASAEAYLVGGAVRDALLHRPIHDLDLATPGDGRRWAKKIANALKGKYYPLDDERGIGRAIVDYQGERFVIDVAQYRGATLHEDLTGRDFTINALAVPLKDDCQQVIDAVGGLKDLGAKRIRQCSPEAIANDPIRALRAIRQSVVFKFMLDAETRQAIRANASRTTQTSAERVRDELMNILGGPRPHAALRAMDMLGLLSPILPELDALKGIEQSAPHIFNAWEHTLQVVERLDGVLTTFSLRRTDDSAADSAYGMIVYFLDTFRKPVIEYLAQPLPNGRSAAALLVLGALLHDCGKPATRTIEDDGRVRFPGHERTGAAMALSRAEALRLSSDEVKRCSEMVHHHMRPALLQRQLPEPPTNGAASTASVLTRRQIYRFWNATKAVGLDVCMLSLADYLGTVGSHLDVPDWLNRIQVVKALLDGYFNHQGDIVAPIPLLDGKLLMEALELSAGPEVGRLLGEINEARAAGEITTAEEALALARRLHEANQ